MNTATKKEIERVTAYVMADKDTFFKGENVMNNLDPKEYAESTASVAQEGESGITFLEKNEQNTGKHRAGKVCTCCGGYKQTKKVGKEFLCRDCVAKSREKDNE